MDFFLKISGISALSPFQVLWPRLSKFIHLYKWLIFYKFRIGPSGSDLGSSMQSSPHHSPRNSSPVNAAGNLTNNLHKMVIFHLTIFLNLSITFSLSFLLAIFIVLLKIFKVNNNWKLCWKLKKKEVLY